MKHMLFAALLTCVGLFSADVDQNANAIKMKWMDWAHENVAREKETFLKKYGVDQKELDDAKLHADLKLSHDRLVQDMVALYDQIHGTSTSNSTAVILGTAKTIFPTDVKIRILSHDDFLLQQVSVCRNYATKECFINLNSEQHVKNIPQLKEILRHELSHIIYEDNFHRELVQCLVWTHSQESYEEIEEASYLLRRAHEIRADVYATLHSCDHGKYLIDFYATDETTSAYHPTPAERIAILKKIRQDLAL